MIALLPGTSEPALGTSSISEAHAIDRFRALEHQSIAAKAVGADEMIDVALAVAFDLFTSARAWECERGRAFDAGIVRRCAVLGKTAEFLGLIQQHRDTVLPILQGRAPRARRG